MRGGVGTIRRIASSTEDLYVCEGYVNEREIKEWDDWDLYERCVKDALHRFMPKDRFYRGHADVVKEMLALSTCRPHSLSRTLTLIHIHSHARSLSFALTLTHTHSHQHALSPSLTQSRLLPLSPALAVSTYSLLLSLATFFLDPTLLFLFHSRTPHTHTGPQWTMLSCEWCPLRLSLFFHPLLSAHQLISGHSSCSKRNRSNVSHQIYYQIRRDFFATTVRIVSLWRKRRRIFSVTLVISKMESSKLSQRHIADVI